MSQEQKHIRRKSLRPSESKAWFASAGAESLGLSLWPSVVAWNDADSHSHIATSTLPKTLPGHACIFSCPCILYQGLQVLQADACMRTRYCCHQWEACCAQHHAASYLFPNIQAWCWPGQTHSPPGSTPVGAQCGMLLSVRLAMHQSTCFPLRSADTAVKTVLSGRQKLKPKRPPPPPPPLLLSPVSACRGTACLSSDYQALRPLTQVGSLHDLPRSE